MARIAGPVIALFVAHLSNAGQQFLIGGCGQIQSGPFLANSLEAWHRLVVPFSQLPVIEVSLAGKHIHRGLGLWHRDLMGKVIDVLRCRKFAECVAIFRGQVRYHQRHVALFLLGDRLLPYLRHLGGLGCLLFLPFKVRLRHLPGFLVLFRLKLRPVSTLVGIAIHRDKQWPATHHHASVLAWHFQTLCQVELFKQRANRVRHVLYDLTPNQSLRRRCWDPLYLDRLYRKIRNRARLQQVQLATRERPLNILRQPVVQLFNSERRIDQLDEHVA